MQMEEYEKAGEALGRLLIKTGYPRVALFCLTVVPISIFIGLKFLFV
jgi:hypothetical protein|tara:strand:- start:62 stop:202 length:141 start_codon:yes stop_codon:yes gene_type:complete